MKELINTADAVASDRFGFVGMDGRPATLFAEGIGSGETVDLQFTIDAGTTWNDVYCNGSIVKMSPTNNVLYMNVRGNYRINKAATAGVVKVILITEDETV